MKTKPQPIFYK